jgi:prepilin-type N-terminal cleavage/methylation domain-containing protein
MSEGQDEGRSGARGKRGGFTLVELLVAMVVLVTGMASVLALFLSGVSIHKSALDGSNSALVAELALARVQAELAEGGAGERARGPWEGFPGYEVEVTVTPLDGLPEGDVVVRVIVTYRTKDGLGSEEFVTLLPVNDFLIRVEEARRK